MAVHKLLVINDLHAMYKDPSTVRNYVTVWEKKMQILIALKKELELTGIIINGDFSDGGYYNQALMLSHRNMAEELAYGLEHCILVLGNHFYIERDSNLEMFLIQPHPVHRPRERFFASKQIFQTPSELILGKVQLSFFHFSKDNKLYINERKEGIKHHIGFYHDDAVLPGSIRADQHIPIEVTSKYLNRIYANIDEGVCAHIHKPFDTQYLNFEGRVVPIHIPGSLSITENSKVECHSTVNAPLYIIDDETDGYSLSFVPLPTLIEELNMVESKTKERQRNKEENLTVYEPIELGEIMNDKSTVQYNLSRTSSLLSYLAEEKGYNGNTIDVVNHAINGELNINSAIDLYIKQAREANIMNN